MDGYFMNMPQFVYTTIYSGSHINKADIEKQHACCIKEARKWGIEQQFLLACEAAERL